MVITQIIECLDCERRYRIRYSLGNNYPQASSFLCYDCSAPIETGYEKIYGEHQLKGAKFIECDDLLSSQHTVVNLHPEIPISQENINEQIHFQSMDLFRKLRGENVDFDRFREIQIRWSEFYDKWGAIKKPLRIFSAKGKNQMMALCSMNTKDFYEKFDDWIGLFLQGDFESIHENLIDEWNAIDTSQIKEYVRSNDKFIWKVNEFCKTYMQHSRLFQSSYLHQVYGWEFTDDQIPMVNWDDIDTVYGDLYELMGDFYVIPTMINNVKIGRGFDEFQTEKFTLKKYLKTDKAGRATNFTSNDNLAPLANAYVGWLRNGTHHKNSHLNLDTYQVSLGTSKGGTIEKQISLIDYIKKCNELFATGLVLTNLILYISR